MKKFATIVAIVLFILSACSKEADLDEKDYEKKNFLVSECNMTIQIMPSPPQIKETSDKELIENVLSVIDATKKIELKENIGNGWEIYIHIVMNEKEFFISYMDNKLCINQVWYDVEESLQHQLLKIFNEIQEELIQNYQGTTVKSFYPLYSASEEIIAYAFCLAPKGYAVVDITGVIVEYSLQNNFPTTFEQKIYYGGPRAFFVKHENQYVNVLSSYLITDLELLQIIRMAYVDQQQQLFY